MEGTKDRNGRAAETTASPHVPRRRWLAAGGAGLAALLIGVVIVLGYESGRDKRVSQSTTRASQPGVASTDGTSVVRLSVPDFAVTAAPFVGGQRFVLSKNADKPTLLYFIASFCDNCVLESRAISQLQPQLGNRVNFVVLDIDPSDTEQGLQHFWEAVHGANNLWARDEGNRVTTSYNVRSMDTTILIAGGQEVSRTIGGQSVDQLKTVLAKAGVEGP